MALVVRVGRGSGWRRRGDDRTLNDRIVEGRALLEGSVGTEGEGGQGVRVRLITSKPEPLPIVDDRPTRSSKRSHHRVSLPSASA